jgi:hypothetical protein
MRGEYLLSPLDDASHKGDDLHVPLLRHQVAVEDPVTAGGGLLLALEVGALGQGQGLLQQDLQVHRWIARLGLGEGHLEHASGIHLGKRPSVYLVV